MTIATYSVIDCAIARNGETMLSLVRKSWGDGAPSHSDLEAVQADVAKILESASLALDVLRTVRRCPDAMAALARFNPGHIADIEAALGLSGECGPTPTATIKPRLACPNCGDETHIYTARDFRWNAEHGQWDDLGFQDDLDCTECDHKWPATPTGG